MQVIGAGLSCTGTLSTKAALEQLSWINTTGGETYHIPFWMDTMDKGRVDASRARQELGEYKSGVDLPVAGWYKEFMEIFPDAKVLFTVRDPKKGYKSACFIHHILITMSYNWLFPWFVPWSRILHQYVQKI